MKRVIWKSFFAWEAGTDWGAGLAVFKRKEPSGEQRYYFAGSHP
ncbi:hypothetical protein ACFSMW_19370 [Virgibacillus halophilus]